LRDIFTQQHRAIAYTGKYWTNLRKCRGERTSPLTFAQIREIEEKPVLSKIARENQKKCKGNAKTTAKTRTFLRFRILLFTRGPKCPEHPRNALFYIPPGGTGEILEHAARQDAAARLAGWSVGLKSGTSAGGAPVPAADRDLIDSVIAVAPWDPMTAWDEALQSKRGTVQNEMHKINPL
jgi:hypothetical protein